MPEISVTVAIPVRNGGALLAGVLDALSAQTVAHELLVCDSGSNDGSLAAARAHGARVIEIAPGEFGHGTTRNLLMREARGSHVALLSQDAQPADERWLERLLGGFDLAEDIAIVYGPYRPRPGARLAVALELQGWFATLSPDGCPRVDRMSAAELAASGTGGPPSRELIGVRGFFTDANACLARSAWRGVPYRDTPYAEDRSLALDMLRAGYAKAYVPGAAVLHSHDYPGAAHVRRCFDEWRGLREVYGWREPASPRHLLAQLRGAVGSARRDPNVARLHAPARAAALASVALYHAARLAGAILGSRADRLPPPVRLALSLERRSSFVPLDPIPHLPASEHRSTTS